MAFLWNRKGKNDAESTSDGTGFVPPRDKEKDAPATSASPYSFSLDPVSASPSPEPEPESPAEPEKKGFLGRITSALASRLQKTRESLVGQIRDVIKAASVVDENLVEKIEEILIGADLGVETTQRIVERLEEFEARGARPDELLASFKESLREILSTNPREFRLAGRKPTVVLVIGVNGAGKTTTIGKLAAEARNQGLTTLLAAGDTFRAAAVEQLQIWAERTGSSFLRSDMGADSAGLAFDAVQKAADDGTDVVFIDTAGRLHTKSNLMEELKKIERTIGKVLPGAPHETLLVLDATTGQNALSQAKVFTESVPVTGLILTKLDGTAKGGVLIGVRNQFPVPVWKIGVGEGVDDLRDFNAEEFVEALFEEQPASAASAR